MNDWEKYKQALLIQRAERESERFARLRQRFASIDERCPRCGNPIRFALHGRQEPDALLLALRSRGHGTGE
jgi:hypothetical protein